jgi:hypothetical protein
MFLSIVYIVNFDMGLATSIDTRPMSLTIMPDPKKYGSDKRVRSKIFGFDD